MCSPRSAIQSSPQFVNKNQAALIESPTSVSFPTQFQLLLLLLGLAAVVKAGAIIPQSPGCPITEDKKFPQHVKLNLNILNRNTNPKRPTDYYKRSTSPWTLQYVRTPDTISAFFYRICIRLPVKSPWELYYSHRIISQTWTGHCANHWFSNFHSTGFFDRAQDTPSPMTPVLGSHCPWHQKPTKLMVVTPIFMIPHLS